MYRKSALVTMIVLAVALLLVHRPHRALADQDGKPKGQLQGIITDSDGDPLPNDARAAFDNHGPIRLFLNGNPINNDASGSPYFQVGTGGFYRITDVKPGLYEVIVYPKSVDERPQRFLGVLIKGGEQTRLDIKFNKGQAMEVVGTPLINIPPAIVVSEALEKMQKQIDDLSKQVEELKKK